MTSPPSNGSSHAVTHNDDDPPSSSSTSGPSTLSPSTSSTSSSFGYVFSIPSWRRQWEEFHDTQRIERLQACLRLDDILRDCRSRHSGSRRGDDGEDLAASKGDPIEGTSDGLRIMKYFGWRGIVNPTRVQDHDDNNGDGGGGGGGGDTKKAGGGPPHTNQHQQHRWPVLEGQMRQSCAREQHAVWACRAVATGCGKDLGALKRCFEEETGDGPNDNNDNNKNNQEIDADHRRYQILTNPYTNYDGKNAAATDRSSTSTNRRGIPCHDIQERLGRCVTISAQQLLERKQEREKTR